MRVDILEANRAAWATRQATKQAYNRAYYAAHKTARIAAQQGRGQTYATYTVGPKAPGPYLAWHGAWYPVVTRVSPDGQLRLCVLEDIGGLRAPLIEKEPPHAP